MNDDTKLIASLLTKGTPEERAAYNRIAMAHNQRLDHKASLDLDTVSYQLSQSVNRLDCLEDGFDDVESLIVDYQKHPETEKAAFLGLMVMQKWEQIKTLVFDAKAGVQGQVQNLAHYEKAGGVND